MQFFLNILPLAKNTTWWVNGYSYFMSRTKTKRTQIMKNEIHSSLSHHSAGNPFHRKSLNSALFHTNKSHVGRHKALHHKNIVHVQERINKFRAEIGNLVQKWQTCNKFYPEFHALIKCLQNQQRHWIYFIVLHSIPNITGPQSYLNRWKINNS